MSEPSDRRCGPWPDHGVGQERTRRKNPKRSEANWSVHRLPPITGGQKERGTHQTTPGRASAHGPRTGTVNPEPRTSNLEPRTSNLEPRTSNLEPRTSNLEQKTTATLTPPAPRGAAVPTQRRRCTACRY